MVIDCGTGRGERKRAQLASPARSFRRPHEPPVVQNLRSDPVTAAYSGRARQAWLASRRYALLDFLHFINDLRARAGQ